MKKLALLSLSALTFRPSTCMPGRRRTCFTPAWCCFTSGWACCSASADCGCCPTAMRQPAIVKLATLVLIVGAVLGLALIYTGASRPYTKLLFSHGAVSALAVALLAGWWFSQRKEREPQPLGSGAWRMVAVAIVIALGAKYSRAVPGASASSSRIPRSRRSP